MSNQLTVLDALVASLQKAADYNRDDTVPPAAVLWPDEKREWERLVPRLRAILPHFLVLGPYDKAARTGPAIWLRCVLAGKVTPPAYAGGSPNAVPIIYLPGVSRATLRATEECPPELKPLAELQYRGVFWSQQNGKDWTITAFLQTNHGGLQLKIAKDQATAVSIRRAIEKLVDVSVADLQVKSAGGELNSTFFHLLISDDPVDDLLTWLSDPDGTRKRWENDGWETMCSDAQKNYGFDPPRDGPLVGAEHLGLQTKTAWKTRVESLLAAGWREVRIVTDHGWLLLPKGLPKTDLPKYLTATRWGRCAVVKPHATVELTCFSWFWEEDVRIACPPGIDCFVAGKEYSHGGLSLQECLVPQFTIQAGKQPMVSARIESFKWAGLRCHVKVEGNFEKCKVDLRDRAADASTSLVVEVKSVGKDGRVSLVVKPDKDSCAESPAHLVLLDPAGNVLEKTPVTVGG